MTKIAFLFALLSTVLVCFLPATPAQAAGVARTFLSAAGSDSNSCTNVATPCRHMAAAYAATAPDGEIYVLDPANYGSLTITHGVSIEGHGWASIAAPTSGSAAIIIAASPGDKINIIGVVLDGTALSGTVGIRFNSGGRLIVRDSVIRNFGDFGIFFEPSSSSPSQLFVSNTLLSDNAHDGINIGPSGSGAVGGAISHVNMEGNGDNGFSAASFGSAINVTVSDSVASGNGSAGILADVFVAGGAPSVMVRNSTITNNGTGLEANNSGAIRVTRSTITGNGVGWSFSSGGVVETFGDNDIVGNTTVNNAPPFLFSHQ